MLQSLLRWLVPIVACLGLGPLAAKLTYGLRAYDGGGATSLLNNISPAKGVFVAIGVMALSGIAGVVAAAIVGTRLGLFSAGLVLVWAAYGLGQVSDIVMVPHASGTMWKLAAEGLLVGVLGVTIAWVVLMIPQKRVLAGAGQGRSGMTDEQFRHAHPIISMPEPRTVLDKQAPLAFLAALVVAGVVIWIITQTTFKGQTFAAATLGTMLAAAAARVVAMSVSAVWVFVGVAVLAVLGPLLCVLMEPNLPGAALAGNLFRLATVLPLDYLAGAFVGAPMGLAWGASLVTKHTEKA